MWITHLRTLELDQLLVGVWGISYMPTLIRLYSWFLGNVHWWKLCRYAVVVIHAFFITCATRKYGMKGGLPHKCWGPLHGGGGESRRMIEIDPQSVVESHVVPLGPGVLTSQATAIYSLSLKWPAGLGFSPVFWSDRLNPRDHCWTWWIFR